MENIEEKNLKINIFSLVAIGLSLFALYTTGFGFLQDLKQRSLVLGLTLTICCLDYLFKNRKKNPFYYFINWILMVFGLLACFYVFFNYELIMSTGIIANKTEVILGIILVISILEATRRAIGPIFSMLSILFLLYAYFGPYMPFFIAHKGYSLERIFGLLYVSAEGIWGQVMGVAANVIPIFLVLGAILGNALGRNAFKDIAIYVTGNSKGGTANVAVVSSALFGTISGSPTANVVTTGTFTIPSMKSAGFSAHFAAAVESVASSGGVIMPPIMGAGAFIMSTLINVPYVNICKAAFLPAILYFSCIFFSIQINSPPTINIQKNVSDLPEKLFLFKEILFFIIPLTVLITLLILDYTPMRSAFWAVIAVILLCFSPLSTGSIWGRLKRIFYSLEQAGHQMVFIVPLCASAGILVGIMSQTGLPLKLCSLIIKVSENNLFIVLSLAAGCTIMLGMAVPPSAAYIIASVVAAPAIIKLGVPVLAAHLFIFYFAVSANITPPVCGAVFVSSGLAGANWIETAKDALKMGITLYIMPYIFAYNQNILLFGTSMQILRVCIQLLLGFGGIIFGLSLRMNTIINAFKKAIFIFAGLLSVIPNDIFIQSRLFGGIIIILVIFTQFGGNSLFNIFKIKNIKSNQE